MTKLTLDEMMFAIGVYPSVDASEKFSLYVDTMNTFFPGILTDEPYFNKANVKELSHKKKASFSSFLTSLDIHSEMVRYQKLQIEWIHLFSSEYPEQLKQIFIPPVVLFYKGDIQIIKKYTLLGVVGSREYTEYGKKSVDAILSSLVHRTNGQIATVSGLAKGIDTEAHLTTIKAGGHTVGVIATGLDYFYPSKNKDLQRLMALNHLVISEYPLGSEPLKFRFPERNRIIAGLSRGVLVVEARKSSGSLITAYNAIEESRDVFAVPGSIFEETYEGTHRLIQLGAILTTNDENILNEWVFI